MTPSRWQEIERVYNAARNRPSAEWDAFLATACAGNEELRAEVARLLAEKSSQPQILDRPAWGETTDVTATVISAGTQLGPYKIESRVGAGGMGEVYRATDTRLGRPVAIKISQKRFDERFQREGRAISALNHPHICTLYDVGPNYLVMELVEGETLATLLKRGKRPLAEAIRYASQIADALAEAHAKGIIHRDLKPGNIMISRSGVKVLDFGLAKCAHDVRLTADGAMLGTPAYMAPEQWQGKACDPRTDLYALGLILCELVTGKASERGQPSGIALLPPQIARIVERCVSADPEERWHSAADIRVLLEWAGNTAAVPETQPKMTRRSRLMGALAIAVLALGCAALLWMGKKPAQSFKPARIERVTFDPGLTMMPTISRDGQMLAYASDRAGQGNLDIWVQQTAGGAPIRLTNDPGDDQMPDFSPDGSQIVFQSTRAGGGIYVAPTLGGAARLIAPGGRAPRFSPDGSRIAYWIGNFRGNTSSPGSAVYVISLAGGVPLRMVPDFVAAREAIWSPDGRSLLLLGRKNSAGPLTETFDWWWAPLDGRAPVRTGALDLRDFRAAADGERISLGGWNESGVLFSENGMIWLQPVSPGSGRLTGSLRLLASGAGLYSHPSMSRDGRVVFAATESQRVIERLPLSDLAAPPIRLFNDGQSNGMRASQTRDGASIVFERVSGQQREIWKKNTVTGEQQLVLPVKSDWQLNATVSQDGSRIAFTVTDDREKLQTTFGSGYVAETVGGVPKQICERCTLYGFLNDNTHVLAEGPDGRIRLFDAKEGPPRDVVIASHGRLDRPSLSPNERWIAFRKHEGQSSKVLLAPFSQAPASADAAKQVDEPTTTGRPCGWSPDSTVLYLLLDTDGSRDLWGQSVGRSGELVGQPYVVRHLHGSSTTGYGTSLGNAVSPSGFLYEALSVTGSIWRLAAAESNR